MGPIPDINYLMCGLWLSALIFCQMGGWCQSLKDCKTWAQVLPLYICLCGLKSGPTSIPWPLQFGLSISMDRNLIRLVPGPGQFGEDQFNMSWTNFANLHSMDLTHIAWICTPLQTVASRSWVSVSAFCKDQKRSVIRSNLMWKWPNTR